ncbi:1-phosphofructokinase [Microbacterium chocolatum]|uniref:1-phosphofructokinase family hexose kinase n=1 Tax=Microbacterium aurantiacum TaxID=162393 RepID=UPI00338F4669
MIVTLTANPSLDRTVMLDAPLQPGEVQAARAGREDAGGKGINVARVVAAAGVDSRAVLPLSSEDPFDSVLRATRIDAVRVPIAGLARANLTVTDPLGVTTKLNLPGATLSASEADAVIAAVVDASRDARWLVLAGSVPPGAGDDFYVRVIEAVRGALGDAAPRIAVDTSGAALRAVVAHGRPDLIKPNDEELAELTGVAASPDSLVADVTGSARGLVASSRIGAALVTLGGDGAVLATPEGEWYGRPPRIEVASTVGAGDSALAGYLLAEHDGAAPADRLRSSILYGAAAASLPGTQAPRPSDLPHDDVPVTPLS